MGERQWVVIARALANNLRLLLADEPTGHLDSRRGREVLGILRGICTERGIPILLVTHDSSAKTVAERVYTLRDGALVKGLNLLPTGPAVAQETLSLPAYVAPLNRPATLSTSAQRLNDEPAGDQGKPPRIASERACRLNGRRL